MVSTHSETWSTETSMSIKHAAVMAVTDSMVVMSNSMTDAV
jgi:hypothetical protein